VRKEAESSTKAFKKVSEAVAAQKKSIAEAEEKLASAESQLKGFSSS